MDCAADSFTPRGSCRHASPPVPSHSNGGRRRLPGLGGMVCLRQWDKPPSPALLVFPLLLLPSCGSFSVLSVTPDPALSHTLCPRLSQALLGAYFEWVTVSSPPLPCTLHSGTAWGPSRSQPSQREEVQTPQPAVLGFLHLLSTTFPGPSPPTSCCVPGTPARLDLDESRFQSLHDLVSTFMQGLPLLIFQSPSQHQLLYWVFFDNPSEESSPCPKLLYSFGVLPFF